jgi:hypothetical protein
VVSEEIEETEETEEVDISVKSEMMTTTKEDLIVKDQDTQKILMMRRVVKEMEDKVSKTVKVLMEKPIEEEEEVELEAEDLEEDLDLQMVEIKMKIDLKEEDLTMIDPIVQEMATIDLEELEDKEGDKTEKLVEETLNNKVNEILDFLIQKTIQIMDYNLNY